MKRILTLCMLLVFMASIATLNAQSKDLKEKGKEQKEQMKEEMKDKKEEMKQEIKGKKEEMKEHMKERKESLQENGKKKGHEIGKGHYEHGKGKGKGHDKHNQGDHDDDAERERDDEMRERPGNRPYDGQGTRPNEEPSVRPEERPTAEEIKDVWIKERQEREERIRKGSEEADKKIGNTNDKLAAARVRLENKKNNGEISQEEYDEKKARLDLFEEKLKTLKDRNASRKERILELKKDADAVIQK